MTQPIDPDSSPDACREPRLAAPTWHEGPMSYAMTFRLNAGHDRVHLAQARRALEQVRGR